MPILEKTVIAQCTVMPRKMLQVIKVYLPCRNQFAIGEGGKFGRGFSVFCISLKAGGTGLNLTAADIVIHYDPWWNPAAEDQATDRAHRIGQTHDVDVVKLIAQGTIEEKVTDLSKRKRAVFDRVVMAGETELRSLSEEDIRALFFS